MPTHANQPTAAGLIGPLLRKLATRLPNKAFHPTSLAPALRAYGKAAG